MSSFVRSFLVSVFGTGLSRIMGLVRDIVITRYLGAGMASDAFWMAWTIPGMFRRFVADEGLTGALVPAVARAEVDGGTGDAQTLANQIFTALLLANSVLIAVVMAVPDWFVYAFASGFLKVPGKFELTVEMTRWLMPLLGMVSLASFFEGVLNHRGHFFVPKVAPAFVSAGLAFSLVLLGSWFEEPAWALVIGTAVGGVLHVLIHLPVVWRLWGSVHPVSGQLDHPQFKRVFREVGKVVAIGVFGQLNVLVLRNLSSQMNEGAVTQYTQGTRMVDLAQGLIGVAIGGVLLAQLSRSLAEKDWGRFGSELNQALRLAAFLLIPSAVGLFIYAIPLISILYLNSKFTWNDVLFTGTAVQLLTPFLLAVAGVNILKRVFFALERRNLLVVIGAIGVGMTYGLGQLFFDRGIAGLAVALSGGTIVQFLLYLILLKRELGDRVALLSLLSPLIRMALSTIPMGMFAYWAVKHGHWTEGITPWNVQWFVIGIVGAAVLYAIATLLLGVEELHRVLGVVRRRLGR